MIINTVLMKGQFEDCTLKEKYEILKRIWRADRYGVMMSNACISPFNVVTCMCNHDLRKWLEWVNLNICLQINSDTTITTGVKLRIATGMLNKLESLTDLEKIQIHSNLVRNVKKEEYDILTEDLPF